MNLRRRLRRFLRPLLPSVWELEQAEPRPLEIPAAPSWPPALPHLSFGIVTPSLNQGRYIRALIDSLCGQSYPNLQHIIQDAGSRDETLLVLSCGMPHFTRLIIERDSGQADGINRAMRHVEHCDILAWVNADDFLLPGALWRIAEFFMEHPQIDAVYGNRIIVNADGQEIGRWVLPAHEDWVLSWSDFVPQETLFFRAAAWRRLGGLDADFHFCMDWDLLLRMRDAGMKLAHLPHYLGVFRWQAAQKTQTLRATRGEEEYQTLWRRCHGMVPDIWQTHRALLPFYLKQKCEEVRVRFLDAAQGVRIQP